MEKFALLDLLKAFQSLSAKQPAESGGENTGATPTAGAPAPKPAEQPQPAFYETNVMANVIARHEEIANRIRNKK